MCEQWLASSSEYAETLIVDSIFVIAVYKVFASCVKILFGRKTPIEKEINQSTFSFASGRGVGSKIILFQEG